MKIGLKFSTVFLCAIAVLPISGRTSSAQNVADIETAVIKQDYALVQQLSEQWLQQGSGQKEEMLVLYYLGLSHLNLQQYEAAEVVFQRIISSRPSTASLRDKTYLGLFNAYYLLEQYDKAQQTIRKLSRISPKSEFSSLVQLKLARVYLKTAQWDKARKALKKILDEYPQSLEAPLAKQLLEEKQYFAVQVGAFMEKERATSLVEELVGKNEYAYIVERLDPDNKIFFRVRVGQLSRLDEARQLKTKLAHEGYPAQIYP